MPPNLLTPPFRAPTLVCTKQNIIKAGLVNHVLHITDFWTI
jgi:hypothetical protein